MGIPPLGKHWNARKQNHRGHTDKAGCEILHVIMLRDSGVVAPFNLWCIVTRVPIRSSYCNWYYTGFGFSERPNRSDLLIMARISYRRSATPEDTMIGDIDPESNEIYTKISGKVCPRIGMIYSRIGMICLVCLEILRWIMSPWNQHTPSLSSYLAHNCGKLPGGFSKVERERGLKLLRDPNPMCIFNIYDYTWDAFTFFWDRRIKVLN